MARFIYKSGCSTCREVRKLVRELAPGTDERDYQKQGLTRDELETLLDSAGSVAPLLNVYNRFVQQQGWKKAPPSRSNFIEATLSDNNLIRRPILVVGDQLVIGRANERYRDLLSVS